MEIAIGLQHVGRELRLEIDDPDAIRKVLDEALADGRPVLWLNDAKGRQVAIVMDKLAYLDVDADKGTKQVGFAIRPD